MMRVLGIDPGYAIVGYGLVEKVGNSVKPLQYGVIRTEADLPIETRLLEIYDDLMHIHPDIDIYSKLYETAISNVEKAAKNNPGIFAKQDIRGINTTTHAISCLTNLVLNIIPKYLYCSNMIHLNFKSINKNTGFQILDIEYEFAFYGLSSSNRDADERITSLHIVIYVDHSSNCWKMLKPISHNAISL